MKSLFILLGLILILTHTASCADKHGTNSEDVSNDSHQDTWQQHLLALEGTLSLHTDYPKLRDFYDFDGDGIRDYLYFVRYPDNPAQALKNVKQVNLWQTDEPGQGAQMALLIIHGQGMQFLIHDRNTISVLDTNAARESHVLNQNAIIAAGEGELAQRAAGDIIVLPTEAGIDTYLYWDGTGYQLYEVYEIP